MESFIIVDRKSTDWRFDPSTFIDQLSKDWPGASIRVVTNLKRPASHEWSVSLPQSPGKTLGGFLSRSGHLVSLEGTLKDSGLFALWVRSIVPEEVPLKFFDDQHPQQFPLTQQTTLELITEAFN